MPDIKAIETYYNGYRFRSRLEARWAVFFDALGIKYQYEPEGFRADSYYGESFFYLPDFFLPELKVYVEVKANKESLYKEQEKISWCIDWEHTPLSEYGLLVLGQIPFWQESQVYFPSFPYFAWRKGVASYTAMFVPTGWSTVELITDYYDCSEAPDLPRIFQGDDLYYCHNTIRRWIGSIEYIANSDYLQRPSEKLRLAFLAARQARFEHGEKPNL